MKLADAVERLEEAGIPCALIGGAALAAHGVARATLDVDLLVVDPRALDRGFWPAETRPEIRRGDLDDPLIGLVRFESAAGAPQDLLDVRLLLASDPAIAPIVEARLGEVPASIRGTWSELPR